MPLFSIDHYQLSQLSLASSTKPNNHSPMHIVNIATFSGNVDEELYNESLAELKKVGLIKDDSKENYIAPELEPLFFLIHEPERVWHFYKQSQLDIEATYFCWRSDAAAMIDIKPVFSSYNLMYPYSLKLAENWFTTEFLTDIKPKSNTLKSKVLLVDANEMMFISIFQSIYKSRAQANNTLSRSEQYISIDELVSFDSYDILPELIRDRLTIDNLKAYLNDKEVLLTILSSLHQKGIIGIDKKEIYYSDFGKQLFDPGNILDFIQVTSFTEENSSISSMYVLDGGYLIQSPVEGKELIAFTILPSDVSTKELMYRLLKTKPSELMNITKPVKTKKPKTVIKPSITPVAKKQSKQPKSIINCSNCGKQLNADAKFCNSCGNSTKAKKEPKVEPKKTFCRECGSELKAGAAFCNKCGTKTKA